MTRLYLLGPAEIRNEKGELEHSFLAGPKRLALLTYLLLSTPQGFHRRDSLLPLFWPEQDQKSARNSLSNMLYHIRKTLGREAIENRGAEEVKINTETLWADTIAFRKACGEKDLRGAMDLYRGELLKGFHVSDISTEFDYWIEQERKRFHVLAIEGCTGLAEKCFNDGDIQSAGIFAKKAASLDPYSEALHTKLISFLDNIGDQPAAIYMYENFANLIRREFGDEPGIHLKTLEEEIKAGMRSPKEQPKKKISAEQNRPEPSIAVLPFETLGVEKATAFTEAIYGDILTRLSQISELFVTSRTSAQHYSNPVKQLPQIARELKVAWILTGEVQERDNRVKVSVRLINASEDRHVWAEIYERELTAGDLFYIQAEITQKITEALKMRLSNKEEKAIRQIPTENLEAFRLQAYGRWNLDQRSEKGMQLAEEYFRKAIFLDPYYAQAWLGLADALSLLHDYGYQKDGQAVLPEAEKAALTALRLDPTLDEAYASLGLLHATRRKGKDAIKNLEKAVELRPSNAEAHAWLCWILLLTGNSREGLRSARTAVTFNPLSQESVSNLSLSLLSIRDYEGALHEAKRLLQFQPDFTTGLLEEGVALYHLERYEEAKEVLRDLMVPWAGNGPLITYILCCIRAGEQSEVEKLAKNIEQDEFARGLFFAVKGEMELAFQTINRIEHWNYWEMLSIFHYYPELLDPIREDKRFSQILKKVNSNWGLTNNIAPSQNDTDGSTKIVSRESKSKTHSVYSIAVLPFKDLNSLDPLFTYGLHGDILTSLSRVKDLQVIYRTSVKQYENTIKTAAEIGEELKVLWLLEGDVKQTVEDIKVNLRLINVTTNSEIWTQVYRKQLTAENIFFIQEKITKNILEALDVNSPGIESNPVAQNPTNNLQAYRFYIQGRNCLDQRTETAIYQGLDCFQGAIETDPAYSLAWSGIADALSLLYIYGFPFPKNSPDPLDAALKAVELNNNLGEAHTSLGIVYATRQNGAAGYKELELAVKLTPGYAEALIWFGWINLILNRPIEALDPAIKGLRLNPLAPAFRVYLADIYLANREYEKALAEARRAREINPDYGMTHFIEGLAFYHTGRFEEAARAFKTALDIIPARGTPNQSEVKTALAFTYYALGDHQWGLEYKDQIFGRIDPFPLGMLQALYGETGAAFQTLTRVQDWTSFATEFIRYLFPKALASLRNDKRFPDLIVMVNTVWGLNKDGSIS